LRLRPIAFYFQTKSLLFMVGLGAGDFIPSRWVLKKLFQVRAKARAFLILVFIFLGVFYIYPPTPLWEFFSMRDSG
jgi:hypothetical protein